MKATCIEITERCFIVVTKNGKSFELPFFIYKDYNISIGMEIEGVIRIDKKKNIELFEPDHPRYKIDEIEDFPIISFFTSNNKNFITVKDCFGNIITVSALKWQNFENLKNSFIKCKIINIKSGKPVLINVNYSHPIYKIGNEYEFNFVGFDKKILPDGKPLDVLKLKGIDGCIHETPTLPSQSGYKFKPKTIKCRVIEISSYLKLEQTSFKDPYFASIEDIVKTDSQSIQKYFYSLKSSEIGKELFLQYESTNSLWTITYCNKVLPELIQDLAQSFNFKEAIKLIDILLDIENWILNNGLIDSFKKHITKEQIIIKSEHYIEKYKIMKLVFGYIERHQLNISEILEYNKKAIAISYYLRFNKPELIDKVNLFSAFIEIVKQNIITPANKYELNILCVQIEYQKNNLKSDELEIDFAIGNNKRTPFKTKQDLHLFLQFTLMQAYLNDSTTKRNIYLGEFFKYLTFYYSTDYEKKNSLKLAYQIITSQTCCIELDIDFLKNLDDLDSISTSLKTSITEKHQIVKKEKWVEIITKHKENNIISVRLKQRTLFGYIGYFENVYCILPMSHIYSATLKCNNDSLCDITINAEIQDTYYNFGTIIVKELPLNHEKHKINYVLAKEIEKGDIIRGRVKNITNYGVFLSTFVGDGLLHAQNITNLHLDSPLKSIFVIGEEIQVCVLSIEADNKFNFGLKQLKGTSYAEDLEKIEFRIYSPGFLIQPSQTKTNPLINADLNKQLYIQGHLFEYFSNLQFDFEGKIKYLKLSKVYYSAILSSRSYFLNTYIAYFDILRTIENTLDNKSLDLLSTIVNNAKNLLIQLEKNTKTIEKFPSISRLLYFLDVVQEFNNTSINSFQKLSNYLLDEKYLDFPILNKVTKVVLSNNLIISEKYDCDFIFKNLRILFQYLKDGVFDISESENEKKERDLKERIANIRTKIFNEESEKVEFKSSLIKPVLDNHNTKKLNALQKKNDFKVKGEIDNLIGKPAKNRITHSAMKTLVAFANSKGGTLFIGINDEGEFVGLGNDYQEIGQTSRDELGKRLDEYINNYIGNSFFGLISINFESIDQKDILIIDVKASDKEVFLIKDENACECSDFYIRRHSSSVKLSGKELLEYYKLRHKTQM